MHELFLIRGTFVAVEICFKNRFHYVSYIPKDHFLGIALQFFFFKIIQFRLNLKIAYIANLKFALKIVSIT